MRLFDWAVLQKLQSVWLVFIMSSLYLFGSKGALTYIAVVAFIEPCIKVSRKIKDLPKPYVTVIFVSKYSSSNLTR